MKSAPGKGNIVLIGMPGAGKSTIGIVLAKILNKGFIDADLVIQNHYGETLQVLIDRHGPEGFIRLENDVLRGMQANNAVIATGGSAVYSDEGMRHLASIGTVIYLKISCESLVSRLGDLDERGVVMRGGASTLNDLFAQRQPLYERHADLTVNVDVLTITSAARKIAQMLQSV